MTLLINASESAFLLTFHNYDQSIETFSKQCLILETFSEKRRSLTIEIEALVTTQSKITEGKTFSRPSGTFKFPCNFILKIWHELYMVKITHSALQMLEKEVHG